MVKQNGKSSGRPTESVPTKSPVGFYGRKGLDLGIEPTSSSAVGGRSAGQSPLDQQANSGGSGNPCAVENDAESGD